MCTRFNFQKSSLRVIVNLNLIIWLEWLFLNSQNKFMLYISQSNFDKKWKFTSFPHMWLLIMIHHAWDFFRKYNRTTLFDNELKNFIPRNSERYPEQTISTKLFSRASQNLVQIQKIHDISNYSQKLSWFRSGMFVKHFPEEFDTIFRNLNKLKTSKFYPNKLPSKTFKQFFRGS